VRTSSGTAVRRNRSSWRARSVGSDAAPRRVQTHAENRRAEPLPTLDGHKRNQRREEAQRSREPSSTS
jgi:hypothetical protein